MKAYPHLTAPIKLGTRIVKSRMFFPNALPHFQQGPENYPADPIVTFYSDIAKNGAGIILYHHLANKDQRNSPNKDGRHFPMYEPEDLGVQNYMCQLTDAMHYYGGLAAFDLFYEMGRDMSVMDLEAGSKDDTLADMAAYLKMLSGDEDLDVSTVPSVFGMGDKRKMTEEDMEQFIDEGVQKALFMQSMGFDAGHVELARYSLLGQFLSPIKNKRDDQYGGSLENRMRFPLMALRRMREALGEDFLIIAECTCQDEYESAPMDDYVAFLKEAEPYIDLLHIRYGMYGTGFEHSYEQSLRPRSLDYCAQLKAKGVTIPICAWTGFTDPARLDAAIATGKIDMVSAGRLFISNPDLGRLITEGRGDDVVPCIKCNRCHGVSLSGNWVSVCGVNPQLGLYARIHRMITQPQGNKRIAIIGGGPAGMYAAKLAAERGHSPVIFEASDSLGGQLKASRYPSFKWPLKNLLDFLIYQMGKKGVEVRLNTYATPELIAAQGFDAVLACTGAQPKKPNIPGADSTQWNTLNVFGSQHQLGEKVVCVGGSESGCEAALYLAENGHQVTLLTRNREIAHDANAVHWKDKVQSVVLGNPNITAITQAKTTKLEKGCVTYEKEGKTQTILCDDVVAAGGMRPLQEEAMAFADCAPIFYILGDGKSVGDVRTAFRQAFAAVSQI